MFSKFSVIFSFFAKGLKNFKAPFRKKNFGKFLKFPKLPKIKFYENFWLYSKLLDIFPLLKCMGQPYSIHFKSRKHLKAHFWRHYHIVGFCCEVQIFAKFANIIWIRKILLVAKVFIHYFLCKIQKFLQIFK